MREEKKMSLWALAWPIFLEMFLQFLLGTVDTFMVSSISDDAVAVIGISVQLFNAVNILFMAVASGTGILVAQKLGAKNEETARLIGIIGTKACMGLGALLSMFLFAAAGPIARWLQVPEALQPIMHTYISIVGGGMVLLAAMSVLGSVIRNTGNTRGPMYIAIGMNVIHVCMNYIVIHGTFGIPHWGLTGVACSTLTSRLLGTIALLFLFRNTFRVRIDWRDMRYFDRAILRETLKLSWPLGINMSSWCFTQLVIYAFIASLGAVELSAKTYMNTMESFCFMSGFSIALAGQIRIAHLYGSRQDKAAYSSAYQVLGVGLAVVMGNTLLLFCFGKQAIRLFTGDSSIVAVCVSLVALNLLLQPAKMLNMAMGNALMAVGETRFIMLTGMASMWVVAVGFSYLLGIRLHWGLIGIYAAMISDESIRGLLVLFRWRSKKFMMDKAEEKSQSSQIATNMA